MSEKLRTTQFRGASTLLPDKLKTPLLNTSASTNGEGNTASNSAQNSNRSVNPALSDTRTSPVSFQPFATGPSPYVASNAVNMMPPYGINPYGMGPMPPAGPSWNPMFQTPPYWYPSPASNYPGYPHYPMMPLQGSTSQSVTGASEAGGSVGNSASQTMDVKAAHLNLSSESAANNVSSYSEPEKNNRRDSQSTSRSRGQTPVSLNAAPQYPQHSSPFNAYTHPPPLPQAGMSPFIHRPQPLYPSAPPSMEYAYHQMFSQYQGMLRDWENRMSLWRQKKQRSSIGSKSNMMGSQTSQRRRHSLTTDEAYSPTPSSILTQNEDESDDVQSRDDENGSVKASAVAARGRSTPAKFIRHSIAKFSPNFSLLYTDLNYKFSLIVCSSKHDTLPELLETLPGPLYSHSGKTPKNEVKRYLSALIKRHKTSAIAEDDSTEDVTLLLKYLLCLVINNGDVEEVDIRELLADTQDDSSPLSDFENSTELSDLNDTFVSPAKANKEVMEKLRKLLLLGKCKEFVELAMSERLWGLALRFSKLMSHSLYVEACHKFDSEHFNAVDPIQAYINVKTGTGLNVADIGEASNFDWKRHLGVILANSKDEEQRHFYCSELGNILAARKKYFASQLCYLVGKCPFGMPSEQLTHLVLIGLAPTRPENLIFTNITQNYFCIVLTMIYEYAVRSSYPEFFIPFLQYCNFFVARRYVDCGLYEMAYRFCDSIAGNVKRDPSKFDMTFISQLKELSQMLMFKLSRHKDQWIRDLEDVSSHSASQSFELFPSVVDCTSSRVEKGSSTGPLLATWDETLSNNQTPFASSTAVNHSKQSSPVVHRTYHKDSDSLDKPSSAVFDFYSSGSQKHKSKTQTEVTAASSPKNHQNRDTTLPSSPSQSKPPRPGPTVPEDEESVEAREASIFYPNSGSHHAHFNSETNHLPDTTEKGNLVTGPFSNQGVLNDDHIHFNGHSDQKYSNTNQESESASFTDRGSNNDSTLVSSQQFSESFHQVPPPPEEPFAYSYSSNFSSLGTNRYDYTDIYDQTRRRSSAQHSNLPMNSENILELGDPEDFYSEQQQFGAQNNEEAGVRSSRNSDHRSSQKSKSSYRNSEAYSGSGDSVAESSENEDAEDDDDDDDVTTTDVTTTNESSMMSSLEHSANVSQSPTLNFQPKPPANQVLASAHNKAKFNFGGAPVNDFSGSLDQHSSITAVPPPSDLSSYSMSHISSIANSVGPNNKHPPNSALPLGGASNPFSRSANSNKLNQYKQYPNAFKISEAANIPPPSFPTPQHMYEPPSMVPQSQANPSFTAPIIPQNTQTSTERDAAPPVEPRSNFYGASDFGDPISSPANPVEPAEEPDFVPVIPTFFNPKSFKKPVLLQPQKLPSFPMEQPTPDTQSQRAQPPTQVAGKT